MFLLVSGRHGGLKYWRASPFVSYGSGGGVGGLNSSGIEETFAARNQGSMFASSFW